MPRASLLAAAVSALTLVVPATATATEPASTYNAPGQAHATACARPVSTTVPLRYLNGAADGFEIPDPLSYTDGSCPSGQLRLDLHEIVDSPTGPLAFARGGNGYADAQNAKYGQVLLTDLAEDPGPPTPSGGGRGNACPALADASYAVQIASIPATMHYKPNSSSSKFDRYGDPGAAQGDRTDIHYSYLLWSFLNVGGGGMVRALLHEGQVVQPCDVDPVLMDAFDDGSGVNGTVLARYVRTEDGAAPLYGWMVWEHDAHDGSGTVPHSRLLAGTGVTTPPQTPTSPPVVRTASAASATATSTRAAAPASPPAPPPSAPPPPPVAMRAGLSPATKATLDAHGRVRVPLACTGTAATACTGTLRLDAALPAKAVAARFSTLARRSFSVGAGTSAVVTLRVRAALRRHLPRGRGVPARLVLISGSRRSLRLVRR